MSPASLTPGTLRIERVASPSLATFLEYAERQTPVIITNYSYCFAGMSLANIESLCGELSVTASRRPADPSNWASVEQCEETRTLAEQMRELASPADAETGCLRPPAPAGLAHLYSSGIHGAIRQYHDIVGPEELIYIPGNSLHQVGNVGFTVSLAGNFISKGNIESVRAEIRAEGHDLGRYYQQVNEVLLVPGFNTSVDPDADDLGWTQYKQQRQHYGRHASGRTTLDALEEASEVLVSGAGSDEVNGCYVLPPFHGKVDTCKTVTRWVSKTDL